MELQRDSSFAKRLQYKARLLRSRDRAHEKIKTVLIVAGGGMEGIFGMGVLHGLSEAGFLDAFDVVVGISAGACDSAYFLSNQTSLALTVYLEDLIDDRFINFHRLSKVVDIDYLENVFRKKKKLDTGAIRKARPDLYFSVTELDGKEKLIEAKKLDDIITGLKASMAMPVLYNRKVTIGKEKFVDGGATKPLPVKEIIERFRPTDVLIVVNEPLDHKDDSISFLEKMAIKLYLHKFSKRFQEAFLRRNRAYHHSLHILENERLLDGINVNIVAPVRFGVGLITQDPKKLKEEAEEGTRKIISIFGISKPRKQ